ncbi:MAG: cytochrome c peroxidase [Nitrospiraceae bacterium]
MLSSRRRAQLRLPRHWERCGRSHTSGADPDGFRAGSTNTRRVEPRNTPTVVNAVFNHRQFWDGRADNVFNGVNEMGDRDPNARIFRADNPNSPVAVQVRLEDSSLASQAVVPPVSPDEMSARGRTMRDIGKKLARYQIPGQPASNLRPLALQLVHTEDSVLGPLSRWPQKGLNVSGYPALIQAAFHRQWWDSPKLIRVGTDGTATVIDPPAGSPAANEYSLMQHNFSLFFGLAIQMYEATLVADNSPYDQFMDGNPNAISPQAILGVDLFRSQLRGQCITCHEGAELTGASVRQVRASPTRIRDEQAMDRGFNNIGVLATLQDLSLVRRIPRQLALDGQAPQSTTGGTDRRRWGLQSARPAECRAHGPVFPQRRPARFTRRDRIL